MPLAVVVPQVAVRKQPLAEAERQFREDGAVGRRAQRQAWSVECNRDRTEQRNGRDICAPQCAPHLGMRSSGSVRLCGIRSLPDDRVSGAGAT